MDKLGLSGVVSNIPQASGTARIAGRVVTFKVGPGDPLPGPPRHLGTTAVELAGSDERRRARYRWRALGVVLAVQRSRTDRC